MEVVAQALPVPAGRPLVPEVLGEPRRFRRNDLVLGGRRAGVVALPFQGYAAEPPARTGLLVDVYG
jgi:hypothetical protein